ncbi:hypothetical protein HY68_01560 [Streptomyces sp. AcH 505]|uniref:hypothetical protein n=1 Tax=Streptomyces sp. AcH 505 TaxID=352211 RepID=UPI000591A3D0|nr:hypothetical protein HY68_01560 [Streptomyces sp. AcH 505]
MTDGWGTVVAAVIGFAGLFVGLLLGRRQVRDQAQVEHGQWLRGQRQQAYLEFLNGWERAVEDMRALVAGWDDWWQGEDAEDPSMQEAWAHGISRASYSFQLSAERLLERIHLLGPDAMAIAASDMQEQLVGMRNGIMEMLANEHEAGTSAPAPSYRTAWLATVGVRYQFLARSREVTLTAPTTGRRRLE